MGVSASRPHLGSDPDCVHQLPMLAQRRLCVSSDAIGTLGKMCGGDRDQPLDLELQRPVGEDLRAEVLKRVVDGGGKSPTLFGEFARRGRVQELSHLGTPRCHATPECTRVLRQGRRGAGAALRTVKIYISAIFMGSSGSAEPCAQRQRHKSYRRGSYRRFLVGASSPAPSIFKSQASA